MNEEYMRVTVNDTDYQITRKLQSSSDSEEVFKFYTDLKETEHEFKVTVRAVPGQIDTMSNELDELIEIELTAELEQLTTTV